MFDEFYKIYGSFIELYMIFQRKEEEYREIGPFSNKERSLRMSPHQPKELTYPY